MKIAIYNISTGEILRRGDCSPEQIAIQIQSGEEYYLNAPDSCNYIIDGEPTYIAPPPPPPPTTEEQIEAIIQAIEKHMNYIAKTRNYDSIISLASYANSTDAQFKAEAEVGIAWRDACWRACYNALGEVKAGNRTLPTPEGAIAELPVIQWPS